MKQAIVTLSMVLIMALLSAQNSISQTGVDIPNIVLWDKVNVVYTHFFGYHKPVRCVVPVGKLHYGCLIEAECVAGV